VPTGVTFDLLASRRRADTSLNISIGADTDQITNALQTFVTDYNRVRDDVIGPSGPQSDGNGRHRLQSCSADGTMRQNHDPGRKQVLGTSGERLTMSRIGLSFNPANELVLNTSTLSTALQ